MGLKRRNVPHDVIQVRSALQVCIGINRRYYNSRTMFYQIEIVDMVKVIAVLDCDGLFENNFCSMKLKALEAVWAIGQWCLNYGKNMAFKCPG